MHLITPLATGFSDAGNGSARIFRRGTSTYALIYTDFEAQSGYTPSAPIALDSDGRVAVYVDGVVDVTVYDSTGAQVFSFTDGVKDSAVEIISQSFTGVDYVTAASAASKPLSLQSMADLWLTQNGAKDWKVLANGSPVTVQAAISGLAGVFFNVKDVAYGAVGDTATDDTSAVQAALTAAAAAGGGTVVFPPGTYRVTSALTVGANVSLMGNGSQITIDHATADLLSFTGATTKGEQIVEGLYLSQSQANTGNAITVTAAVKLVVDRCVIGCPRADGDQVDITNAGAVGSTVTIRSTTIQVHNQAADAVNNSRASLVLLGVTVVLPGTYDTDAIASGPWTFAAGCVIDASATSTGTIITGFALSTAATIVGCKFVSSAGASGTAISCSSCAIHEFGNTFGTNWTPYYMSTATGVLSTRDSLSHEYASDTSPLVVDSLKYGTITVKRGAGYAGAMTLTPAAPPTVGEHLTIIIWNPNGGGATGLTTFNPVYVQGSLTATVNASSASAFFFRSIVINNTPYWVPFGKTENFAP